MGRFTAYLLRSFRAWERSSQVAFLLALVLLLLTLLVLLFGPANLRQPALIGLIGLVITVQIIFMWANRGMVTPFTQAQRCYLAEDFESARRLLEAALVADKPDVQLLTLLGNTYRQLGLLDKSEEVLTKALELRPFDHFPLYGFGRTLLVKGLYASAGDTISRALEAGAPPIVQFDLGEARYRQGLTEDARLSLEAAQSLSQEPHRALMTNYLLYRLRLSDPPSRELIQLGLPYWQDNALRYRQTPYGQVLADDVRQMQTFIQEN
jgi:tetratricopeptide (TPR) repeat protein